MFKSTLLAILAVATGVYAQFPISITKPLNNEFVHLGAVQDVTIHADVPAGTAGSNVQLSLCQVISGPSSCNASTGTIVFSAPFNPPEQTYSVFIPATQAPGVNRLFAAHVSGSDVTDVTSIEVLLGSR